MNYNNQIPAWSYSKQKKEAQFGNPAQGMEPNPETGEPQRMARYRGVMVYEVRVPAQPESPEAEQAAADQAANELYQKVHGVVGDEIPIQDPPEKYA